MKEKLRVKIEDNWCIEGEPQDTYLKAIKHLGVKKLFELNI